MTEPIAPIAHAFSGSDFIPKYISYATVSYIPLSEYNKQVELNTQLKAENAELKKQIDELYAELKELNRETEIQAQQSMLQAELDVLTKKIQMRASKKANAL
jgi:predicted transcriptional regulator